MTVTQPNVDAQWDQLRVLIDSFLTVDSHLHLNLLDALAPDRKDGFTLYLGMKRAPAASGHHHAREGGLVQHMLEMWQVWMEQSGLIAAAAGESEGTLTHERVLKFILYHDLHKAFCTYVLLSDDPWKVEYGKHESDTMLTNDTKTLWILQEHGIILDIIQMNAILLAEGGYSKIRPRKTSVLAKVGYLLDEMSGNVIDRVNQGTSYNF